MSQSVFVVDAFTDLPYSGNPAAVCVMQAPADAAWMQLVAREMNLSETAFVTPERGHHHLRWFTPTTEVDLCGHATLASAHVLWEQGHLAPTEPARFQTRSGMLSARRHDGEIVLDFPLLPALPVTAPPALAAALGAAPRFVGKTSYDYLVELESERVVRELRPDLGRVAALDARGVMVTSRSADPAFDFVSRFFGPSAGVPEDPVTGSAHCSLGPYWSERLGKTRLFARQVSARGGTLRVEILPSRVAIAGRAITVMRGALLHTGPST